MTSEEYVKKSYNFPYTLIIKHKENLLYYFGEVHTNNPDHNQWGKFREFWEEFLIKTESKKRIVFVEGGIPPCEDSESKNILANGGSGLTTFLAIENKIEIYSPEPDRSLEIKMLEEKFSRDEIIYAYFARQSVVWHRFMEPRIDFSKYINNYLNKLSKHADWKDYDFSIDNIKRIHENIFGKKFENDLSLFKSITDPYFSDDNVVVRVIRQISHEREIFIVGEILRFIKSGYSIFVEYGGSHLVVQEPLLREMLEIGE